MDPDIDFYPNFLEFVFGGDPFSQEHLGMSVPWIQIDASGPEFLYERFSHPALVWEYQFSKDFVNWESAESANLEYQQTVDDLGNGTESVSVTVETQGFEPLLIRISARLAD